MGERGVFLVFEGGDGVGKSTQTSLLARWLRSPEGGGRTVVETREPGGTDLGKRIRELLQDGGDGEVDNRAEALLYAADRAQHVATVVRPALERGDVVVQDRYVDSSIVYQGGVRGLGDEVARLSEWATEGLVPTLTIVLDAPVDARRIVHDPDRIERETDAQADDLRQGFLERAHRDPTRYVVVDATRTVDQVAAAVRAAVTALLG
jgi:dTMP kinase